MTHIILAMPHRGRLNLLTGLLEYDPAALLHKVKGGAEAQIHGETTSGDVLSHLGTYMLSVWCFYSE
jgi:probable 2-oxoglutarate dehydrogenase E1 component DHKTD1